MSCHYCGCNCGEQDKPPSSMKVKIDGRDTTLTFVGTSHGGYQYNEPGNVRAHTFPFQLTYKMCFRTNGQRYETEVAR